MAVRIDFSFDVSAGTSPERLDAYLSHRLSDFLAEHHSDNTVCCSRSFVAALIRNGNVFVDGMLQKPGYRVRPFQKISGCLPPAAPTDVIPESIPLDIRFQDNDLLVINKPAGLVVHPSPGHSGGTLVNALLFHCPSLEGIGGEQRPGIVHRLDKDTSGLLLVAKNAHAHHELSRQFKVRTIQKKYLALVQGSPAEAHGKIDLPVGRHPGDRKKMSTKSHSGRNALTLWAVKERFAGASLLEVDLKTGRTHQIRVHCQAMGHPIVGDPVYGPRNPRKGSSFHHSELYQVLKNVRRQMLHAVKLVFIHPVTGASLCVEAPLPDDMSDILDDLRQLV
jgi:23S rRNA pseudouridine1911/1915/1917 synthase